MDVKISYMECCLFEEYPFTSGAQGLVGMWVCVCGGGGGGVGGGGEHDTLDFLPSFTMTSTFMTSCWLCCTPNPLGFSPLWFEPRSGHMWESQVLLTDGQVVFLRVLRFSPTFDERSARYK